MLSLSSGFSQNKARKYCINQKTVLEEEFYSENKRKLLKRAANIKIKRSDEKKLDTDLSIQLDKKDGIPASINFGNRDNQNKLYINFCLPTRLSQKNDGNELYYYYELKNRQSVKIKFTEWSFNALSTPVKINFTNNKSRFSTGSNLGVLIGKSRGSTTFTHLSNVGNIQKDKKQTFGFYLGVSKINFSFTDELNQENDIEAGLVSPGLGYLLTYERFNFGTILGLDYALGDNSSKWNFQGSPWLGISLGYSLFSF